MGLKLTGGLLLLTVAASGYDKIFSRPWLDASAPIAARVAALLDAMTLTEKVPIPTTLQGSQPFHRLRSYRPTAAKGWFTPASPGPQQASAPSALNAVHTRAIPTNTTTRFLIQPHISQIQPLISPECFQVSSSHKLVTLTRALVTKAVSTWPAAFPICAPTRLILILSIPILLFISHRPCHISILSSIILKLWCHAPAGGAQRVTPWHSNCFLRRNQVLASHP